MNETKKQDRWRVVAGRYEDYRAYIQANRGDNDTQLCLAQSRARSQGWRLMEICATIYGFSIRHASGLDGFGLVRGSMTLREAVAMARRMAASTNGMTTTYIRGGQLELRRRLASKFQVTA